MSDHNQLLSDILQLFVNIGVTPGQGDDGRMMVRIQEALAGIVTEAPRPKIELPRGRCPCCGAPNLMECDCDPDAQMKAWEARQQQ
jgi:hypothetical protein